MGHRPQTTERLTENTDETAARGRIKYECDERGKRGKQDLAQSSRLSKSDGGKDEMEQSAAYPSCRLLRDAWRTGKYTSIV